MRDLILSLLISFFCISAVNAQVILFTGPNNTGTSIKVNEGSISRMANTIIGNDRLGSMIVPPGYRVTLYQHDYFGGYAETFTYSVLNLPPRLVNEVSSLVVTNDNGAGWVSTQAGGQPGWNIQNVMIYSECYFGGRSNPLLPADYAQMPSNFNFATSSIRIPSGYEVDVFSQPNFSGRMVRLRGDEWCLPPEWNNTISSIRVYKSNSGFVAPDNYNPWVKPIDVAPGTVVVNPSSGSVVVNPQGSVVVNPQGSVVVKPTGSVVVNPPGSVVVNPSNYWDRNSVTLFDQCNFNGLNAPLADGNYSTLPYGFQQRVMSMRIPQGKEVLLYYGPNFTGSYFRLISDRSCMSANNEYMVASMRIQPIANTGAVTGWIGTPPPRPVVVVPTQQAEVQVFTDCFYQSRSMILRPGRNPFLISPFSDNISSVRVPYRRRVILYTGINFTGNSWIITGDNNCLNAHFNNRIRSIIVEAY